MSLQNFGYQVFQMKKYHVPYINEETRAELKEADLKLTTAITNYDWWEWREYNSMRNK